MKFLYLVFSAAVIFALIFFASEDFNIGNTALKPWAMNQVSQELSHFKKTKFKETDIADIYQNLSAIPGNMLLRFQIIDGVIYSNYNKLDRTNTELIDAYNVLYKFFKNMIKNHGISKNVEFVVSVSDRFSVPSDYVFKAPIIVPIKNPSDKFSQYMLLAPDHYTISEWPRLYNDILSANLKYPWNKKIEKAFWRGSSSTGGLYTRENWQDFPRVKLVELSSENPNLIDAKFTSLPQNDREVMDMIAEKYPLAIAVSQADHVKYKVQVSVEGNITSLSGYLWRLLSNSVVLKQKTNKTQWFYPILIEGLHYTYIQYDMSDLLDKVKWSLSHDEDSKQSALVGSELIKKEITPEHLSLYWSYLLNEYASLQNFTLSEPSLDKAKEIE